MIARSEAQAQQRDMCPSGKGYDHATRVLEGKYSEKLRAHGVMPSGRVRVEFWSNAETGTWTVLGINTRGCAWPMTSGEGWEAVTPEPGDDGA